MAITREQVAKAESQIVEQSKKIDFFLTEYTVELLAKKMQVGDFEIPAYQREDTWENHRKSRFIESIVMGLPIPFLVFWERPDTGLLEIVDGSQRLRTIQQFILGDMVLGELDTLPELEGMQFRDLTESRQRKVRNRSVRGIVLNEHADEQARFELFDRINTSSKIATKAEVRRGALVGKFLDMVIELAKAPMFVELAPFPDKDVNLREREELVTRFFAYSDGLGSPSGMEGYRDRPSDFLFQYAKKMNAHLVQHPEGEGEYRRRFTDTMAFVDRVFPYGFRRSARGKDTPRTRFEAIAIGSYLAIQERPDLIDKQPDVTTWLTSEEFGTVIGSDGANAIARLRNRTGYVRERLVGA